MFNPLKFKNPWLTIVCVLTILLIIVKLFSKPQMEGFSFERPFVNKTNDNIYDEFYVSNYDTLLQNDIKNQFEIDEIVKNTNLSSNSYLLDIGSGTGHHLNNLKNNNIQCVGIDKSPAMVKYSKQQYPSIIVKEGDALNAIQFQYSEFSHITCLYFTIYYIQDKLTFFSNCMHWLKGGGYLIIHLVDRDHFDPIVPAGDPFVIVSPQTYAKKRITTTEVIFDDFTYKSEFNPQRDNDFPNDIAVFKETFKDKKSGNVRQNSHKLYIPTHKKILEMAKSVGFIIHAKIEMKNCQYENQYLYMLQKPN